MKGCAKAGRSAKDHCFIAQNPKDHVIRDSNIHRYVGYPVEASLGDSGP